MRSIQFSAFTLSFIKGKTQITEDTKTGTTVAFSDWRLTSPDRAELLNKQGTKVAEYPVRQETIGGRLNYVIDDLDPVGTQG